MKTADDFRNLAEELREKWLDSDLAELLQTVYEAGAGDERNATIAWLEKDDPFGCRPILAKLKTFNGWVVK